MLSSLSTEDLIPKGHPIRRIRRIVDEVLAEMDGEFDAMYSWIGRPSVPPEQLLKATILMALYTVRSERAFCERLNYDLLFKWFLDLAIDAKSFDPTTFTKNRDRLLESVADRSSLPVVKRSPAGRYVSSAPISVDGSLLQACASTRSLGPRRLRPRASAGRDGIAEVGFHGQKRANKTHESTTDPESRLVSQEATAPPRCSASWVICWWRTATPSSSTPLTFADRYAERATALEMLARLAEEAPAVRRWRQGLRHPRLRRRRASARVHAPRRAEQHPATVSDRRSTTRHPGHG